MYHVTTDNQVPYYVYGNRQDGPSYRGPSNSRSDGGGFGGGPGIPRAHVASVGGGESGWATPDPVDTTSSGPPRRAPAASAASSCATTRAAQTRNVEVWPDNAERHRAAI